MMSIPGHDDVRQQCQGPEMVPSSSVVRPCFAVIAVMDGALKAVDRLAWLSRSRTSMRKTGL